MREPPLVFAFMFAEDGEGFVEASGGPEGLDGLVEDQADAGGLAASAAEELVGGFVAEASVVFAGSAGDGLGDHPAAGETASLGGQFMPAASGGRVVER